MLIFIIFIILPKFLTNTYEKLRNNYTKISLRVLTSETEKLVDKSDRIWD